MLCRVLTLLGKGILLGWGAAIPIGPVNVEIARRTLRWGFRAGFALGCGAVTVDVFYALFTSLAVARAASLPGAQPWFALAAAIVLGYLGLMSVLSAWRQITVATLTAPPSGTRRNYLTGLLMTLTNPMTLAFWFFTVPGVAGPIGGGDAWSLPLVSAGVFAGALSWVCFFVSVLAVAGRVSKRTWLIAADLAGGAVLLAFAGIAIWRFGSAIL